MGLGLARISFHFGWDLVEWRPKSIDLEIGSVEILEICDEVEEEEPEVFGSQIEINLENLANLGEPSVEATEEAPAVVEILDEPSVEETAGE